jgi:tyrosyl-tRNA synthetase
VARMLDREDFAQRIKEQEPLSMHELIYPLAMGYDSVALGADVELGGTDQKLNLLVGRNLQHEYGQEPQIIMTTPLLEGLDGVEKMSKSLGNYISINEPPGEMFGKIMSISDPMMWRYQTLLTDLGPKEIADLMKSIQWGTAEALVVKKDLARRIVADFHGQEAAQQAQINFEKQHRDDGVPSGLEWEDYKLNTPKKLSRILVDLGLYPSNNVAQTRMRLNKEVAMSDGDFEDQPSWESKADPAEVWDPKALFGLPNQTSARFIFRVGRKMKKVRIWRGPAPPSQS